MQQRYVVIGLGQFGRSIVQTLARHGAEVVAIDQDMANVEAVKHQATFAVELDATDPGALRSVDAHICNAAIVAMGDNFEAAALTVAALKEIGVAQVVARATTPQHARILEAAGAQRVIQIEQEMGRTLADGLVNAPPAGGPLKVPGA